MEETRNLEAAEALLNRMHVYLKRFGIGAELDQLRDDISAYLALPAPTAAAASAGGEWERNGRSVYRGMDEPAFVLTVESEAVVLQKLLNARAAAAPATTNTPAQQDDALAAAHRDIEFLLRMPDPVESDNPLHAGIYDEVRAIHDRHEVRRAALSAPPADEGHLPDCDQTPDCLTKHCRCRCHLAAAEADEGREEENPNDQR